MINAFQVVLLALVVTAMFYFMVVIKRSAVQRLFVVVFFGVIAVCVLFPDATTAVAHLLGIGRGVDLILYLAVFFLLLAVFQLQLRIKQSDARLTVVVRELACRAPVQSPDKP